jgi:outer membrane autotransporter protein
VAFTKAIGGARVTPSFSAQWQHEFLDAEFPVDARFANNSGSLFTVRGPKVGRDSALLTAAVNVAWSRYAAYVAYQADIGRKNYEDQTVLVGFRVSW